MVNWKSFHRGRGFVAPIAPLKNFSLPLKLPKNFVCGAKFKYIFPLICTQISFFSPAALFRQYLECFVVNISVYLIIFPGHDFSLPKNFICGNAISVYLQMMQFQFTSKSYFQFTCRYFFNLPCSQAFQFTVFNLPCRHAFSVYLFTWKVNWKSD